MKKITLILSFALATTFSYAQSLSANGATTPLSGDETTLLEGLVTIHNSSVNPITVLVERTTNNLATGHTSNFCWGITCYGDNTSLASDPETIAANSDNNSFHGWLNPHGNFGHSTVCYNFFDMSNLNDAVSLCFDYDFATGIQVSGVSISNPLSQASPNPANNMTSISYAGTSNNSRLIIYNLLGNAVKEITLNEKLGTLVIATSDLRQGIYYYSLFTNGKIVSTKKLVIAHK